ncbi:MAG: NUDIX hydrolase [Firmicutes bacterium]|nr:NUDIX hydrolase [Bacillota bacterium]
MGVPREGFDFSERRVYLRCQAVVVREGRLLLVEQRDHQGPYWTLPGGGLHYGESLAECVRRETKEETGLEVEPLRLLSVVEQPPAPTFRWQVVGFLFESRATGGQAAPGYDPELPPGSICSVGWWAPADLGRLRVYPRAMLQVHLARWLEDGTPPPLYFREQAGG